MAQKNELVTTLRQEKYWDVLAAYPTISLYQGRGFINADLSNSIGGDVLKSGRLMVTTGASPWAPPIPGAGECRVSQ
jgi:mercuric reductase